MGVAVSIISGGRGSEEDKSEDLKMAGIKISKSPAEIGKTMKALINASCQLM